ncbi:MAG: ATP--guanido phosphotransferase [Phycisphaerales bacterium JB037]
MTRDEPSNGPDPQRPGESEEVGPIGQAEHLLRHRTEWLRGEGTASDVVLSSRVRLARNLAGFPFMPKATRVDRRQILEICKTRIMQAGIAERVLWVDLTNTPPLERTLLVERHLISQPHAKGKLSTGQGGPDEPRGVAIGLPGERISVMVNEEDHLRIQVMRTGFALGEALAEIDAVDDRIEEGIDYAFHPRFGYLTACPTNVGTGIRFSVMLNLPALRLAGEIEKVKRAAEDMSLAVRGFYGEGTEAAGDFHQLSNQTTLGKSERLLLHEMESEIVPRIIEYERQARRQLVRKQGVMLEDQAQRALGLLLHARLLSTKECMELLSRLRLGAQLGLMGTVDEAVITHLMLVTQPAHLQRVVGREMRQDERLRARADLVREKLRAASAG